MSAIAHLFANPVSVPMTASEKTLAWRAKNIERHLEYAKAYKQTDKYREYARQYLARRKAAEGGGMRVLIACEFSGTVRDAFIARGHAAYSCDLLPTEKPGPHVQGDVLSLLVEGEWDLMIAHPPCTYLAVSGLHWNHRIPGREAKTLQALEFVRALMAAPIPRIAVENPVSCISTNIRKPDQIIQPWQFGHDASKKTCLWLKGLPPLRSTCVLPGGSTKRRANQTASGQNKLPPSPTRWKERSATYQGIADAMAEQWGAA